MVAAVVLVACATGSTSGTGAPAAAEAKAAPAAGANVPANLAVPAGQALSMTASAKGTQIYTCAKKEGAEAWDWAFTAPEADLFDASGGKVGTHFAGPTWLASDGSKVVGAVKEKAASPDDSIPWLLLEAKANEGTGKLASVKYIQRTETRGGKAPAGGCDAGHAGEKSAVPYTATYLFYAP